MIIVCRSEVRLGRGEVCVVDPPEVVYYRVGTEGRRYPSHIRAGLETPTRYTGQTQPTGGQELSGSREVIGADPGGVLEFRTPLPPFFGGPPNFIKRGRENVARVHANATRFNT